VWSKPSPALLTPRERYQIPFVPEAGWASKPVWIYAENLVSTGIRFPGQSSS